MAVVAAIFALATTLHSASAYVGPLPRAVYGAFNAGGRDAHINMPSLSTYRSILEAREGAGLGHRIHNHPALGLHMQDRFPRGYRGGQQRRGRGRGRSNNRGGFGNGGRDGRGDGDGGGMSTDYVRGGMPDSTAFLDEKLDRFLQSELDNDKDWNTDFRDRGVQRDREKFVFVPRGLGRSNFFDDDTYPGKVQRGRVRIATLHLSSPPPINFCVSCIDFVSVSSSSSSSDMHALLIARR